MRYVTLGLWALCVLGAGWAGSEAAGPPPQVEVRPFEIFNAPHLQELAPGLEAMLASRLAGDGYRVVRTGGPEQSTVAYRVRTTITQLGGVYSIDAVLEPVAAGGEGARTYETADAAGEIMGALERVAGRLKEAVERGIAAAPREPAGAVKASAAPPPPAAPAPPVPVPTAPRAEQAPGAPRLDLQAVLADHRLGPTLDGEARSLVAGDVDGDRRVEILVLLDGVIVALRDDGERIVRAWESPTPAGLRAAALSMADVDGNGLPEVFVAGQDGVRPASQALEWFGSALAPKAGRVDAFLRAVAHPAEGALLLGMEPGTGTYLLERRVHRYVWEAGAYRQGEVWALTDAATPLNVGYARLLPDQGPFALVTTQEDRFRIYDPQGAQLYESSERVKGTRVLLRGTENLPDYQEEELLFVQGKTGVWSGPDGQVHLFLARNEATLSRVFRRSPAYSHAELVAWRWDGVSVTPEGTGPKLSGYVPDLDIAGTEAGAQAILYVPLVRVEGTLFKKYRTQLVAYDLPGHVEP
ncbi:MAG: VCBS repeat-containing protein [Deferrisomatales bacterium]